jgi:NAD-dependent deacetylase
VRPVNTAVADAARVLKPARKILVFSGAGISTESGIPDFRGPNGLWTRMDPDDFTIHRYLQDPAVRKRSWMMHQRGYLGGILEGLPNRAHRAVVDLWEHDRMAGCVTQNIDGLHQAAGLPEEVVAELHGNVRRVHCTACPASWGIEEILEVVAGGDPDPSCSVCGAVVKTSTVLFGELLPEATFDRAIRMAAQADAVLAIGSTLTVYPAADLVASTVMGGADLVIVNQGETAFDDLATALLDQSAGEVLPGLVSAII